ncbi:hypothetical protein BHM03_00034285 [Ensete ventricosum]|nr:hypothetical protein BHM03_00034285 [Ensete ventricosum]
MEVLQLLAVVIRLLLQFLVALLDILELRLNMLNLSLKVASLFLSGSHHRQLGARLEFLDLGAKGGDLVVHDTDDPTHAMESVDQSHHIVVPRLRKMKGIGDHSNKADSRDKATRMRSSLTQTIDLAARSINISEGDS